MNVEHVHNAFHNLLKELEPFIDTTDLRIAFDKDLNAYLIGPNFEEKLPEDARTIRLVREAIRGILAKHAPRIHPGETSNWENPGQP